MLQGPKPVERITIIEMEMALSVFTLHSDFLFSNPFLLETSNN